MARVVLFVDSLEAEELGIVTFQEPSQAIKLFKSLQASRRCREGPAVKESSEKRVSDWEQLLKQFSEAHQEKCKALPMEMPKVKRAIKHFPTGSSYEGSWDLLGMSGHGTYTFPNGVIYVGEFDDGVFHGPGELRYPSGEVVRALWHNGELVSRQLFFDDSLEYFENNWGYCKMPDRRFTIEHTKGLQPAGRSYMTATQPTRDIPPGFYDTGDGFYDPVCKVIYRSDDLKAILRSPSIHEQQWIVANCRTNPVKTQGPRLELYEKWVTPTICKGSVTSTEDFKTAEFQKGLSFRQDSVTFSELELQFEYYTREYSYGQSFGDILTGLASRQSHARINKEH